MSDVASWVTAGAITAALAIAVIAAICCRSEGKKKFPNDAV